MSYPNPNQSFSGYWQTTIAKFFIDVVAEVDPKAAEILDNKMTRWSNPGSMPLTPIIPEELTQQDSVILKIAEFDAKLVDVQWRARKAAGINVINAIASTERVNNGDRFDEIIRRFSRANLSTELVQELVGYAMVWPSLTTHPTNPTSFEYTSVGHKLDMLLANPNATKSHVLNLLREVRDTSMYYEANGKQEKKTPQLEGQELLMILSTLYQSVVEPQRRLRAALDRYGYPDVDTRMNGYAILNLHVWGPGDGDGNPNMTASILEDFVLLLRKKIVENYVADLNAVNTSDEGFNQRKEEIIVKLLQGKYERGSNFIADLRSWLYPEGIPTNVANLRKIPEIARDVLTKAKNFGLHYARIDVRHNSVDLMATFDAIVKHLKLCANFLQLDDTAQRALVTSLMGGDDLRNKLQSVSASCEELGEVGGRVFARLRVMAKYPTMFQKLIIAETRGTTNVLVALLLLKGAGCVIGVPGAKISVVPLFESRQDLIDAPTVVHNIATDPIFAEHLKHVGYLLVMIAKSDTTRLSGPGVQGCQELTIGQVLSMQTKSYGGAFNVYVMLGGGDDQMRGGGRIVESPHVVMLAAQRMGGTRPAKVALTIQGLQMQLVFGSTLLSSHFLEAFASQQMLAAARIRGYIPFRTLPPNVNRYAALNDAHRFFNLAMDNYELGIGTEKPDDPTRNMIVNYYSSYPQSVIANANKSSRPMARKKTVDPLRGRAIGLDQLSKHDGAYLTATLGVKDSLQTLYNSMRFGAPSSPNGPSLSALRHMYLANKSFRDFVRMQSVVLCQKEYRVSWALRGGIPDSEQRAALVKEFNDWVTAGRPSGKLPSGRALLAYLEKSDLEEAALLLDALTGQYPQGEVTLSDPIRVGWPDLFSSLEARRKQCELSQELQVRWLKGLQQSPENKHLQLLAYYGYVGTNAKYSTPNFSLTMTDPQKEGTTAMLTEKDPLVRQYLKYPPWIGQQKSKL